MDYIEYHIVDHCNLKCAGCSHFSNIAPTYFKPLTEFIEEFTALHALTSGDLKTIRLMGGEPLLHPEVAQFCVEARRIFTNSEIVLVTNGILWEKRSAELIPVLTANDIKICISYYGLSKVNPNEAAAAYSNTIAHDKTTLYNISLDLDGMQMPRQSFQFCDLAQAKWYFYKDYRLYRCCIMANIHIFESHFHKNLGISEDDIGIDVRTHSLSEVASFLGRPAKACSYCDTIARTHSEVPFTTTSGRIEEWI